MELRILIVNGLGEEKRGGGEVVDEGIGWVKNILLKSTFLMGEAKGWQYITASPGSALSSSAARPTFWMFMVVTCVCY